jgi:enoyl-CoA hydratase/carnithine racemase
VDDPGLRVNRSTDVWTLTLDRPERRNALSTSLRDAISDAIDAAAADPTVKVVVFTGTGPVFCAGFDLGEFDRAATDAGFAERLWASSDRYHRTVLTCPVPTIAAINGPAIAGGFDLAVLCDLRVASRTARFAHPERAFGDVVYGPLHDLVGGALARELTMGGRSIDATEALGCGLVGAVVEPAELSAATAELVTRVCVAPRDVLVRLKTKALGRAGIAPGARTLEL